jgi:putative DNA primase/helicase
MGVYSDWVGEGPFLLVEVLADGWERIAKTRIEPVAWSYRHGAERRAWRHHYQITDKDGHKRTISIPKESLTVAKGNSALRELARSGVRFINHKDKLDALVKFLRYEPKTQIVRVPHTGWIEDNKDHWLFIRPDSTLGVSRHRYEFDGDGTSHGLQISGSKEDWSKYVAAPLEGCSTVALSLATFFATPLIHFVHEQAGGWHLYGPSSIGKTLAGAIGQSVYGLPHGSGTGDTFGRSWAGTATGIEQFAALRSDVGLSLDEIGVGAVLPIKDAIYALSGGTEKLRGTSQATLKTSKGFRVLVLSTGEKSLAAFLGQRDDAEGRRKRLVDVPAEVAPGTSFEIISPNAIVAAGQEFYGAVKQYHGAVGLAWQQYLVKLGPTKIRDHVNSHRNSWLAQTAVKDLEKESHPQVRSVINRFALMAAALQMARVAGLLPWKIESCNAGILACADRWAKQRGDLAVGGETIRVVNALRETILTTLKDRFIELKPDKKGKLQPTKELPLEQTDGYLKPDRILILPAAWSRLTNNAPDTLTYLLNKGWLIPGETNTPGKPKVERIGGGQAAQRFYVLRRSFLIEK